MIAANPGLVRRALANLISTAITATPRGGEIALACSASPAGARVEVRNPGAPIPAADLPRIFDRFFRSGQARAPRSEGHGRAWATVRAIARMHGREADATSTPAAPPSASPCAAPSASRRRPTLQKCNPRDRIGSPPFSYSAITVPHYQGSA